MSALIHLKSTEGQKLLQECQAGETGSVFQPLVHAVFNKQVGKSSCGIQTSAILLAAQKLGQANPPSSSTAMAPIPKDKQPICEETMFDYEATTKVVSLEEICQGGSTLDQVCAVLENHGRKVRKLCTSDFDVDVFRKDAKEALSTLDSSSGVLVNYHIETLGEGPPYGHHSPLAAYHVPTDRFLIMDTWYKTEESWATPQQLYTAMNVVDGVSKKTRGYCVVN